MPPAGWQLLPVASTRGESDAAIALLRPTWPEHNAAGAILGLACFWLRGQDRRRLDDRHGGFEPRRGLAWPASGNC